MDGEDPVMLYNLINDINQSDITLIEFITLVSPYTKDKGKAMRQVMGDDLNSYRRMVDRIYEEKISDTGTVLANEQQDIETKLNDEINNLRQEIARTMDNLLLVHPEFDLNQYYKKPDAYLKHLFPVPENLKETILAQKEKELQHKLHWLRKEGMRLQSENLKLQNTVEKYRDVNFEKAQEQALTERTAMLQRQDLEKATSNLQGQLNYFERDIEALRIQKRLKRRLFDTKYMHR